MSTPTKDSEVTISNEDCFVIPERDELAGFPSSEECIAILTMKCGEPLMAVRKKLHDEITITFIPEEGFNVFQSKVERHFSKLGPTYIQEDRGIFLKPSSNATQSKYVLLTQENFDPLLRQRWKVARSMKVGLKYEIFCYFVDTTNKKEKKRMAMKMYYHSSQDIENPLLHDGRMNGKTGMHMHDSSLERARKVPRLIMPTNGNNVGNTSNAHVLNTGLPGTNGVLGNTGLPNAFSASMAVGGTTPTDVMDLRDDPNAFFHLIPIRINGVIFPIEVDVLALHRSLAVAQMSVSTPIQTRPVMQENDREQQAQIHR